MAKKSTDRVRLAPMCEGGDLNYRTSIRVKGGIDEKVKAGFQKYSPRLRKHTLHQDQAVTIAMASPRKGELVAERQ